MALQRQLSRRFSGSEEDVEVDETKILQNEQARLQRQFRTMEGDKKAYMDQSQKIIRKQKEVIFQLEKEKNEHLTNLKVAKSEQKTTGDIQKTQKLVNLMQNHDFYIEEMSQAKQAIYNLDQEIRVMEKKVKEQRRELAGVVESQSRHFHVMKKIRILENRLNVASLNFNKMLTVNAELRTKLDHLLFERGSFDTRYRKLTKALADGKKELSEIIEQATQAYDVRDEARSKTIALKERSEKDEQAHNQEVKELNRIVENDKKLKEFMVCKANERLFQKEASEKKKQLKDTSEQKQRSKSLDSVENYEMAFERIRLIAGEDDLDTLVTKFIECEDQNFALFNYVNELNNDVETLHEQIEAKKLEIESFHRSEAAAQKNTEELLMSLEEKLKLLNGEEEELKSKLDLTNAVIDRLKEKVEALFNKIGCDSANVGDVLGANTGITNNNIMLYLGIIEQRASDLLKMLNFVQHQKFAVDETARPPSPLVPRPATAMLPTLVRPPTTGDDSDYSSDDEDFVKPMEPDEVQGKVLRVISRKEAANKIDKIDFSAGAKAKRRSKNT